MIRWRDRIARVALPVFIGVLEDVTAHGDLLRAIVQIFVQSLEHLGHKGAGSPLLGAGDPRLTAAQVNGVSGVVRAVGAVGTRGVGKAELTDDQGLLLAELVHQAFVLDEGAITCTAELRAAIDVDGPGVEVVDMARLFAADNWLPGIAEAVNVYRRRR